MAGGTRTIWVAALSLAGCAVAPDSGSPEATLREVVAGKEWMADLEKIECEMLTGELLRTEAEWDARVAEVLPETYLAGDLSSSLVDWASEVAILGYIDCSFDGIEVSLARFDQDGDGNLSVEYAIAFPQSGGDIVTRTYLVHAFAGCGDCALGSVTTTR